MNEIEIFKQLPWQPGDPKTVLVKIAWLERAGGARETAMLKRISRQLARQGLIDRTRLENRRIGLRLTPQGKNFIFDVLLETIVGRRPEDFLTGPSIKWAEARYVRRLLAAADDEGEDLTGSHAGPIRTSAEENCA